MNKNVRGLLIIFGIVIGIVAVMLVAQAFAFAQTVSLQVVADPAIQKIQLIAMKDEARVLLTLNPGKSGGSGEVTLRVNEESTSPFERPVVRYYVFIMTKDGQKYQSDAFNFGNRSSRLRLNIGMAGHWEIVDR
jgi:hypothetical protein